MEQLVLKGLETDNNLTYNPNSGVLTTESLTGNSLTVDDIDAGW